MNIASEVYLRMKLSVEPNEWLASVRKEMRKGPWISRYGALDRQLRFIYQDEEPDETFNQLILPWTVTKGFYQDNPDKARAKAKVTRVMAIQAANDLEELIVHGDADGNDVLLKAMDGYVKRGARHGAKPNLLVRKLEITHRRRTHEHYYLLKMHVRLDLDLEGTSLAA